MSDKRALVIVSLGTVALAVATFFGYPTSLAGSLARSERSRGATERQMKDNWRLFLVGFRRGWQNTASSERTAAYGGIAGAMTTGTALIVLALI